MGSVSEPRFKQLQAQFAGHIRDPQVPVIDGIEDRRMQIYRDLFFNNVEGFTASAFPLPSGLWASRGGSRPCVTFYGIIAAVRPTLTRSVKSF